MIHLSSRPRRNRQNSALRNLMRENKLSAADFILPCFIAEGSGQKEEILSMPGVYRYSVDLLVEYAGQAYERGIGAMALFPKIDESLKDSFATESFNPEGLIPKALTAIRKNIPEMVLFSDIAMDPYSSDGHDGIVSEGKILNDETLEVLAKMAICQAQAGASFVAPSDMMDGRVAYLRDALDRAGHQEIGILAYSAKYASAFYGPFRDALDSAPKNGDKKTYQMDPANSREALREIQLDIEEGADMIMVKPALSYLDIISKARAATNLPVAAYMVSGEYAMIKAAGERGWIDAELAMMEATLSIKRAGADMILSYAALEILDQL